MKVKNIIKGYMSKYDIKEVTIIEDEKDSVIFSGKVENLLYEEGCMREESERIKNAEAKRVLRFNWSKLFIFI